MKKYVKEYRTPFVQITDFSKEDVIRTSGFTESPLQYNWEKWGESGDWMNNASGFKREN